MTATTQTLNDGLLAVFEQACEQEQYVVADKLLSSLEAMAAQLIYKAQDGYIAASDSRRDGQAVGF